MRIIGKDEDNHSYSIILQITETLNIDNLNGSFDMNIVDFKDDLPNSLSDNYITVITNGGGRSSRVGLCLRQREAELNHLGDPILKTI